MCDRFKIKLQQTTHALGILVRNQRLLIENTAEDDLFSLLKQYTEQRQIIKKLENQLHSVTLKTKSQSQQIQDQRQRRLNTVNQASRLHKTIQQIYEIINYRNHYSSPIDQLHYIKKLCEDRLRNDVLSDDEDEDELDSRNCTIDDDHNESIAMHPRVVLPQSSTKKRLLIHDDNDLEEIISSPKRLRYEDTRSITDSSSLRITAQTTFECYKSIALPLNTTQPFTVSTDIKMIDKSCNEQQNSSTTDNDHTLSSSTISSTKTDSCSSIEQTLPMIPTKSCTSAHRFISRKIFKLETCFVCLKRINFGSLSYRCLYCCQSCHVNCKENAGSNCKILSNNAMLPPCSPKTPIISTLKSAHRKRMVNSEPRKTAMSPMHTSTVQRRLPFEHMMLHNNNKSRYFPLM